jgi:hypothetical protein
MVIYNYKHDFIKIREHEYYKEMEPNLQKKLLKYLVARDKNEFKNLFCIQLNNGHFSVV